MDAFDIPDAVLNSALGRYDGDVYTDLYERALKSRNKSEVNTVLYVIIMCHDITLLKSIIGSCGGFMKLFSMY